MATDQWIVQRGEDEELICQDCYGPIADGEEAIERGDDILHARCGAAN